MRKLEHNWQQKTLENLEKEVWEAPNYDSYLVTRCHALRKIPLEQFTTEDLRIMIGQQFGLDYLVPLALEVLSVNIFAEGDYYEGDLLKMMLTVDEQFWSSNKQYWMKLYELIANHLNDIEQRRIDASAFLNSVQLAKGRRD